MIGRRGFVKSFGSAFLCLGLGLRMGAPRVIRPVPAVRPIRIVMIGGGGGGGSGGCVGSGGGGDGCAGEVYVTFGGVRISGFGEGDDVIHIPGPVPS